MAKRNSVLLTKDVVDGCKPTGKRYVIWDKELPGFGLRVGKTGAKTFVAKYRTSGGGRFAAQQWLVIGRFGPLTVVEARKLAKVKLGSAAAGADPSAELKAKRREMTVKALVDFYEKTGCVIQRGKWQGQPMKPRTKQYTLDRLRNQEVSFSKRGVRNFLALALVATALPRVALATEGGRTIWPIGINTVLPGINPAPGQICSTTTPPGTAPSG